MGKRKILYLITKSNWGGAQRYVYDLATGLPDEYAATVATGSEGELTERLSKQHIPTLILPALERDVHLFREIRTFFALISLIRREHPDVLHLNSSKAGGLGALAGRLTGVECIVFTAHGWPFREERSSLSRWAIYFFSWLTALFSHRVIAVSDHDAEAGRAMPFIAKKIHTVHNGIESLVLLSKEEALKELVVEPQNETFHIGMIAELTRNKGISHALSSLALLPTDTKVLLTIIGEGEERTRLEKLIVMKGLKERVTLAGKYTDAAHLLSAFDLFLLSSVKEGLPYVLLEAGCAGLPVVATVVGGVPEIVTDMETGLLVKARDEAELAHAIHFMATHPEERVRFGTALNEHITKNFSLSTMREKTYALYRKEVI